MYTEKSERFGTQLTKIYPFTDAPPANFEPHIKVWGKGITLRHIDYMTFDMIDDLIEALEEARELHEQKAKNNPA